jgi:aspartyl-tRNA(Asn)/glutamyl-tRNA(Gln) amidotransferase subunit C
MPALTRKEVEEIALLARLALEPEELERMQRELGAILEHFEALAAVDTAGVPAMTHAVPMDLRMRADVTEPSLAAELALAATPRRDGDLIVVPSSIAPPTAAAPAGAPGGPGQGQPP